jgi:hypothetical protein
MKSSRSLGWLAPLAMFGLVLVAAEPPAKPANLNDVSMEVAVLQTLHDLELKSSQLTKLAKLARESAPKGENRVSAKTSAEFATALTNLHAAYVKGDEQRISECREKLDALIEKKQTPELDNSVVLTEEAKANASEALKLFNVRQTGMFLGTLELVDPAELLISAIPQVRRLKKDKDREEEIASVAEEVAWLIHGLEEDEASQKIKQKVTELLQRVGEKKDDSDDNNDRDSLEEEARQIMADVDHMQIIGHILEHGMAEMLSNPRLEAAIQIQSRLASKPPPSKKPAAPAKSPGN